MVNRVEELWSDLQARSVSTTSAAAVLRVLNEQSINTSSKRNLKSVEPSDAIDISRSSGKGPELETKPEQGFSGANLKTRCGPLLQRLVDRKLSVRLKALADLQVRELP